MKNKLKFLIKNGFSKKCKSKAFKITNILLLICVPILINIDSIIGFFGGNFAEETNIVVVDNTGFIYDEFYNTFESNSLSNSEVIISKSDISELDSLKENIVSNESKDIILIVDNISSNISVNMISYAEVDSFLIQNINNTISQLKMNYILMNSDLDADVINSLYIPIEFNRDIISDNYSEEDELVKNFSYVLIPIFIVPFFIIITFIIQMIGGEINEEKSSKSMEIIISSVSPKVHFMAKIITVNLFIFMQGLLMLLYSFVGLIIRSLVSGSGIVLSFGGKFSDTWSIIKSSSIFHDVVLALPLFLIIFILSIVCYSLLAGVLASMTTSIEDFQQLQTPIMLLSLAGYYLAFMALGFESANFISVLSVIPFLSCMVVPVLFIMGQVGFVHLFISIILLIIAVVLFYKYGLKIYREGILNYSTSKLWSKLYMAMRR